MPGRNHQQGDYRYGFNGYELDNEIKGTGNAYDFGGRSIYDGRIAKFISVDPRWRDFPSMAPYAFAANNPIYFIDVDGEGPYPPLGPMLFRLELAWDFFWDNPIENTKIGVKNYSGAQNFEDGVNLATTSVGNRIDRVQSIGVLIDQGLENGDSPQETLGAIKFENQVDDAKTFIGGTQMLLGTTEAATVLVDVVTLGEGVAAKQALRKGMKTGAEEIATSSPVVNTIYDQIEMEAKRVNPNVNMTTLKPGEYAVESIAARSKSQVFNTVERKGVNELGAIYGCHTCGRMSPGWKSGNWTPDHQPVSSLVPDGTEQVYFPHCQGCARSQGGTAGALKKMGYDTGNLFDQ